MVQSSSVHAPHKSEQSQPQEPSDMLNSSSLCFTLFLADGFSTSSEALWKIALSDSVQYISQFTVLVSMDNSSCEDSY